MTQGKEAVVEEDVVFPVEIETVGCDLPGFEGVEVDINVFATETDLESLTNRLRNGSAQNVVKDVRNWPKKFGPAPYGKGAPVVFTAWVAQRAVSKALSQYISDPNF